MQLKNIKFLGGQYNCYDVFVGNTHIGYYNFEGEKVSKIPGKHYQVSIKLPGLQKTKSFVEDKDEAAEFIKKSITIFLNNILDQETYNAIKPNNI